MPTYSRYMHLPYVKAICDTHFCASHALSKDVYFTTKITFELSTEQNNSS